MFMSLCSVLIEILRVEFWIKVVFFLNAGISKKLVLKLLKRAPTIYVHNVFNFSQAVQVYNVQESAQNVITDMYYIYVM